MVDEQKIKEILDQLHKIEESGIEWASDLRSNIESIIYYLRASDSEIQRLSRVIENLQENSLKSNEPDGGR